MTWSPSEVQTPIQFSHPLYRTAVYEDLSPTSRQSLHKKAAELPGERNVLAHRVAAVAGVDSQLAGELVDIATREERAGARAQAATYLIWASSLDSQRDRAERHLLRAMLLLLEDWQSARANTLKERAIAFEERPPLCAADHMPTPMADSSAIGVAIRLVLRLIRPIDPWRPQPGAASRHFEALRARDGAVLSRDDDLAGSGLGRDLDLQAGGRVAG